MPDNWSYVFAAYGIAAVTLIAYWRHLARRAHKAILRTTSVKRPHRDVPSSTGARSR
jgi:hypothetical protein